MGELLDLDVVKVLRCGVCEAGFVTEAAIREHTAAYDDHGNTHDGEPWYTDYIVVGETYTWLRGKAYTWLRGKASTHNHTTVKSIRQNADGDVWVGSTFRDIIVFNEADHFVESCFPGHIEYSDESENGLLDQAMGPFVGGPLMEDSELEKAVRFLDAWPEDRAESRRPGSENTNYAIRCLIAVITDLQNEVGKLKAELNPKVHFPMGQGF